MSYKRTNEQTDVAFFNMYGCMFVLFIYWFICFKDVTLRELMDVEDILQECKSQNKKLLEL